MNGYALRIIIAFIAFVVGIALSFLGHSRVNSADKCIDLGFQTQEAQVLIVNSETGNQFWVNNCNRK